MPVADYSEDHVWDFAAIVRGTERQARRAVLRHSIRVPKETKIEVLEVYCTQCRRPYEDVVGEPCVAAESNEHLRGGPIGERKKRTHNHNCELLGCDQGPEVAAG
ncbi:hypothetical protein [Microbispora sp. NPDC049125]|uniref:hypothetical protein n=1 Tax=Microbispora sp. NPDC049125 TaxID=3154929 RepID=UPI003467DB38